MRFIAPQVGTEFVISSNGDMPAMVFTTDGQGPHRWEWSISWRSFRKTGTISTRGNSVDLAAALAELGGTLTVTARVGAHTTSMIVKIKGTNPTQAEIRAYLAAQPGATDFGPIVWHEANGRHFTSKGEPIASFDGGYGIVQLTNPAPTYQQVWSWKRNIDAGLALFATKRNAAIRYLGQLGRSFNAAQLQIETVSRWNGGSYHRWVGNAWVRNPNIVCASGTGNIGWDMSHATNAGQTVQQLMARDQGRFNRPPRRGIDHYDYFRVCYADGIMP